eukprot:249825-Prorocentrum_minimum.AAC.2
MSSEWMSGVEMLVARLARLSTLAEEARPCRATMGVVSTRCSRLSRSTHVGSARKKHIRRSARRRCAGADTAADAGVDVV